MISEIDIEDWDKESQQAYLEWVKDYGISYEPYLGQPDIYAAWKAAVKWARGHHSGAQGWRKRQIREME